jgi:hypothetical protein
MYFANKRVINNRRRGLLFGESHTTTSTNPTHPMQPHFMALAHCWLHRVSQTATNHRLKFQLHAAVQHSST